MLGPDSFFVSLFDWAYYKGQNIYIVAEISTRFHGCEM